MSTVSKLELGASYITALGDVTAGAAIAIIDWNETHDTVSLPTKEVMAPGSKVAIAIGGRFWVATAAHLFFDDEDQRIPLDRFMFQHPNQKLERMVTLEPIGMGWRGGTHRHPDDIAWIEIKPVANVHSSAPLISLPRRSMTGDSPPSSGSPTSSWATTRLHQDGSGRARWSEIGSSPIGR
jgi:hypothetical protein